MSDELFQLLAASIVALTELYAIRGADFAPIAWFWDFIARLTGHLANFLGRISVSARLNYMMAVQA